MELSEKLILKQFLIGPLDNFIYFVGDQTTNEIAVVDPAWDVDFLCDNIEKNGYKVVSVFLTHGHPDHVNGLDDLLKRYDVPAYISKHEAPFLMPKHPNIVQIEDGDTLDIGSLTFKTILTPGHTPGCQCFMYEHQLIAGDLIFVDGCGRCDLPGGDASVMYDSLFGILMKLPDNTIIFPGHNYGATPSATLGDLKKNNPYLTAKSKEDFLRTRMG